MTVLPVDGLDQGGPDQTDGEDQRGPAQNGKQAAVDGHSEDSVALTRIEFEDIIENLGSFGHWQRVIFLLICAADVFGAWCMLLPVFTGATPTWRCLNFTNSDGSFVTSRLTSGLDLTNDNGTESLDICEAEGGNWTCVQKEFVGDFTSIVSQWELICDYKYASDLITSIQAAGLLVGAALFGQLSDLIGRKKSYFAAHTLIITSGFVSAFSPSWQVYAVCRFFTGLGFGGTMVVACVYPLEFVGQRWRTLCGTIGFWAVGGMSLALLGYYIRDWRHLTMTTSGTGFIYWITWFFIPESPRWLTQQGRFEEAHVIIDKIARKNNKPTVDIAVLKQFAVIDRDRQEKVKKYTYIDLFRRAHYCKMTLIMIWCWFTTFLMYYELSYNLRTFSGSRYLNMFLAGFVDLGAMLSVILFNNVLGRRWTQSLFLSIALVSNLALLIIFETKGDNLPDGKLAFALLGKAAALAGTYIVQIFSAELYPTVIRNVGVGAGSMSARVGTIVSPQLVFLGSTVYEIAPHIICAILTAVALPITFLLPETNGRPLQDAYDEAAPKATISEAYEGVSPNQDKDPDETIISRL